MLTLLIVMPIVTSIIVLLSDRSNGKLITLISSLILSILYVKIWLIYNTNNNYFQLIELYNSYYSINIGIDGISLYMIGLTIILIPICILSCWSSVGQENIKLYLVLILSIETILILVFILLDILLFYITFETSLIPMFLLIGIYGARERKIYAAYQFFLITLAGSLFMLIAILIFYSELGTTDYQILMISNISKEREYILWLALFISFAVKTPLIPLHLWLPEAHSEASLAGSIILAGVLLKLSGYGLIRYSINILPEGSLYYIPLVYGLSIISIIYSSLTVLREIDMKKIIAYSSISHMGIVILGIFSYNITGIEGSILLMIAHGLVSPGLFIIVTTLYERTHTRIIKYYRGLTTNMPLFSLLFFILTLANMGVPLTGNFISELMCFIGAFTTNPIAAILASLGIVFTGAYSIWFYNRICFGSGSVYLEELKDLNRREYLTLLPLLILTILLGINPNIILETLHVSVSNILI